MAKADTVATHEEVGDSLRDKAIEVLQAMVHQASPEGIWEGKLTQLVGQLGHMGYYSKIVSLLKAGAATQLKRGSMDYPSVWQITNPEADFKDVLIGAQGKRIKATKGMQSDIDNLTELVGGINVPLALSAMQDDINLMKAQLTHLLATSSVPVVQSPPTDGKG